jgi:hypothetical protein
LKVSKVTGVEGPSASPKKLALKVQGFVLYFYFFSLSVLLAALLFPFSLACDYNLSQ